MQDPLFLTLEDVLEIHAYQVEQLGHDPTVLEIQKLESAIAQPKQVFGGAYLFHICQNHAFADGNKRTALQACLVFLDINGHFLEIDEDTLIQFVNAVASGQRSKSDVVDFLKSYMTE